MGLKATIAEGVTTAFAAVGDLSEAATLETEGGAYNPTTGLVDPPTTGTWKLIESSFSQMERLAGDIQSGDVRLLGNDADKPFTPEPGQSITFRGVKYKIVSADPVQESLWKIHGRRPL